MAIKIQIVAEDKATPVVNRALDNTKKKGGEAAGAIGNRFRDVFENVSQNATGAFGSVAGGLFKLPGPAGIAIGAILGIVGALGAMALKSAQATAATNSDSAKFLATIEKLKSGIGSVVDFIGSAVIPVFNALADVFGIAATAQEALAAQTKAYQESIIASVKGTDEFISKIKEYLDATDRLTETTIIRDYFKAFADGNTQLANAYQKQLTQLKILQAGRKVIAEESKVHATEQKKIIEENIKDLDKLRIFREKSEQLHQVLVAGGFANIQALRERELGFENFRTNERRKNVENEIKLDAQAALLRAQQMAQQLAAQQQIGVQLVQSVAGSLAAAVFEGEKLSKILENILKQLATKLLTRLIFGGLGALFGGPAGFGVIGKLFGGFQHGGEFTIGGAPGIDQNLVAFRATRGERVTITPANQSTVNNMSNAPNISINVNARNFDRNFVRTELVPLINQEVRNGLDLFASKIK